VNYLRYYSGKIVDSGLTRDKLDDNAEDIYDGLKTLKGSALKAQMLSMDKSFFPAHVEKFSLSQFSVPPLSAPLVLKTFKTNLGKNTLKF
jgi:predicted unusual protein kinase regulating ubiquinone biosynthesis (AarF/ABC1/UbiB family)